MTKLKCDWCRKNSEEVAVLIKGLVANICSECVVPCLRELSQETTVKWKPKRAECSFCFERAAYPGERLLAGDKGYACRDCLSQLVEIVEAQVAEQAAGREFGRAVCAENDSDDCVCQYREPTALEKEWLHLANEASDDSDFLRQGRIWLKENRSEEAAGKAIAMLLEVKPSVSLVTEGLSWLREHKHHDSAPELVAELLKAEPSPQIVRLAGWYLKTAEDVRTLRSIVRVILESPPHRGLYKKIESQIERNPTASSWSLDLLTTTKHSSKSSESLVLKWLNLNVRNPEAYVSCHLVFSTSPQVIEAAFDWARRGGRTSDDIASTHKGLISGAAKFHKSMLPKVLSLARGWLKKNPDHEAAGLVYASVLSATGSKLDITSAKRWHQAHQVNATAWYVISDVLNLSVWHHSKPDLYAVEQAQLLLRAQASADRKPRLVCALLGVHTDAESIAWAKEAYTRCLAPLILTRLLLRAPDAETIAEAEASFARLKDREDIEPEMIYSVLWADPKNKVALKRARVWFKRCPENKWINAVAPLIRTAVKKQA